MAGRILIYSHDSFGLGHLRRSLAVAAALTRGLPGSRAGIVTGSQAAGLFDPEERIDIVAVPPIVKNSDGSYRSAAPGQALDAALRERAAILRQVAQDLDPDLFVVDKEPLGIGGETLPTLGLLKARGARLVAGVRDIMDAPAALAEEWRKKSVFEALDTLFDEIWVYGLAEIYRPLAGIGLSAQAEAKIVYTGYLRRGEPPPSRDGPILAMAGGGGDGEALLVAVLSAYERARDLPPVRILLGPFIPEAARARIARRAGSLPQVDVTAFTAVPETLMRNASGAIAMGGYNTFCEILSFDIPALLAPRERPRAEQRLRAERASAFGLARSLRLKDAEDPVRFAGEIRALATRPPPSAARIPALLDGLDAIRALALPWLGAARGRERRA